MIHQNQRAAKLRIIELLYSKGITQRQLAKELNVSYCHISQVISGNAVSKRIAEHIADKLGRKPSTLWPNGAYKRSKKQPG